MPRDKIESISPRRRDVLALLAKGLTNDEIASALGIGSGTVRSHVATLLAELDVSNRTEAAVVFAAWQARVSRIDVVLRRPAIAVLPLVPLSRMPEVSDVAAGLTEDLVSLLSRCCWFPVIATAASLTAPKLGTTTQDVAAHLGARFIVSGSLQRVRSAYRLSVHLDDASNGERIWSVQETFSTERLFATEDSIARAVVAGAYPLLIAKVLSAVGAAPHVGTHAAWQLAHKGMVLCNVRQPDANEKALAHFSEAISIESGFALAHYGVGIASYSAILNQWGRRAAAVDRLGLAAARAVEYAPHCAEGYYLAGRYEQVQGEWDRMRQSLETAVGCNPSFAAAHGCLAHALHVVGKRDEAIVRMKHAVRLGPGVFVTGLATLQFMRGDYAEASPTAERAVLLHPEYSYARALAAACAFWSGDVERGRAHWVAMKSSAVPFSSANFLATFGHEVEGARRLASALTALSAAG